MLQGFYFVFLRLYSGSTSQPVYLNAGTITACSGVGYSEYSKNTTGYILYNNGMIVQWGFVDGQETSVEVTFPITFTSTPPVVCISRQSGSSTTVEVSGWLRGKRVTGFDLYQTGNTGWQWLAIGY